VRVLLRAIPMSELIKRTHGRLSQRTIERARRRRGAPHRETEELLRRAIVAYVDDGGAVTFEAIEKLDPAAIAAEVRALAIERASSVPLTDAEKRAVRAELATSYRRRIGVALILFGL
jgi:hypothetical protein